MTPGPRTNIPYPVSPITRCSDCQVSLTSIGGTSHSGAGKSTATHTLSPPSNQFLRIGINAEPPLLALSMRWRLNGHWRPTSPPR